MKFVLVGVLAILVFSSSSSLADDVRKIAGVVITDKQEVVSGASVTAYYSSGQRTAATDDDGHFQVQVPNEEIKLSVTGKFVSANETVLPLHQVTENLVIPIRYRIPTAHESLLTTATALDPRLNGETSGGSQASAVSDPEGTIPCGGG
jgi:hypothetical protein